jgi:hypothetical protein
MAGPCTSDPWGSPVTPTRIRACGYKVHPFTAADSLDIIHNVHGYLFIFVAGLIGFHCSHHPRGADMEPNQHGGQAHG